MRRYADADLHLLQGLLVPHDDSRVGFGRRLVKSVLEFLQFAEAFLHHADELLVLEAAGRRDDQVRWRKIPRRVISEHGLLEAANRIFGAENRLSEGMVLPEILAEYLMHKVIGVV